MATGKVEAATPYRRPIDFAGPSNRPRTARWRRSNSAVVVAVVVVAAAVVGGSRGYQPTNPTSLVAVAGLVIRHCSGRPIRPNRNRENGVR